LEGDLALGVLHRQLTLSLLGLDLDRTFVVRIGNVAVREVENGRALAATNDAHAGTGHEILVVASDHAQDIAGGVIAHARHFAQFRQPAEGGRVPAAATRGAEKSARHLRHLVAAEPGLDGGFLAAANDGQLHLVAFLPGSNQHAKLGLVHQQLILKFREHIVLLEDVSRRAFFRDTGDHQAGVAGEAELGGERPADRGGFDPEERDLFLFHALAVLVDDAMVRTVLVEAPDGDFLLRPGGGNEADRGEGREEVITR
jgi:hypothetical protein